MSQLEILCLIEMALLDAFEERAIGLTELTQADGQIVLKYVDHNGAEMVRTIKVE